MISSKSLMSLSTSGNSKCDPEELEPDSQVQSIRFSSEWCCSLLLLFIPRKSVMDSKSAKWVNSVWGNSVLLWCKSLILQLPPNRKLVVKGSMTGWGGGRGATGEEATTVLLSELGGGCVWPALLDSKKLVTTSGNVWRMTSGGVGCDSCCCCCWVTAAVTTGDVACTTVPMLLDLAWLTIIEVKSALLVAAAGSTWAEIECDTL